MVKNKDVSWNTAVKRRNSAWRVLQDGTVSNIRDLLCPTFDSSSLFHSLFFSFLYLHSDFDLNTTTLFSPYIPDNLYLRLHPRNFKERISLLTCIYRVKLGAHSSCFATESLAWYYSIYGTRYIEKWHFWKLIVYRKYTSLQNFADWTRVIFRLIFMLTWIS